MGLEKGNARQRVGEVAADGDHVVLRAAEVSAHPRWHHSGITQGASK